MITCRRLLNLSGIIPLAEVLLQLLLLPVLGGFVEVGDDVPRREGQRVVVVPLLLGGLAAAFGDGGEDLVLARLPQRPAERGGGPLERLCLSGVQLQVLEGQTTLRSFPERVPVKLQEAEELLLPLQAALEAGQLQGEEPAAELILEPVH